jgi:hypothetical protein
MAYNLVSSELDYFLYFSEGIRLVIEERKKLCLYHDPNHDLKLWPISSKDLVRLIFKLAEWKVEEVTFKNYQFYRNGIEELKEATRDLSSIHVKSIKFVNCLNPQGILFYIIHHKVWGVNLREVIVEKPIINNFNLELKEMFSVWLIWNKRIRKISYEGEQDEITNIEIYDEKQMASYRKFNRRRIDMIERNQRGYNLCQQACYTLLLIWRFRESDLDILADKNLLLKIVKLLWDTRYDTIEWFIDKIAKRNMWYDIIL